jgi:hypothetical protein
MIDEILTEERVGQKPRFFLHDEVKAWLKENMQLSLICDHGPITYIPSIAGMEHDYYNRYSENIPISEHVRLSAVLTCDGEKLGMTFAQNIDLSYYVKILKASSKRLEENEKNIRTLLQNQMTMQEELIQLKQELAELKQK